MAGAAVAGAESQGTDLTPFLGQLIAHSYVPGYVFLSFLVSFAGCWTALELLHRRTGAHGYHNW